MEKFEVDLRKELQEKNSYMSQKREEKMIRLRRDQRDKEKRLVEEHEKLMKLYSDKAKSITLQDRSRIEELRRREEEYQRRQE